MANILVKRNGGQMAPVAPEWDPFRFARDFFGWDPFREMTPAWPRAEAAPTYVPSFDVKETKESFLFKADIPGIKDKDLEIMLTGNRLTIAGKREAEKQEQNETFYVYERSYGGFTRAFTLPDGCDYEHIHTDLTNGVLTVVVPKRPETQAKRIAVKSEVTKS
jgi:HSP20 family protein